jgi:hypothetical protein
MQYWQTIWRFDTARFTVTCDVTPEDTHPRDLFDNDGDIEDILDGRLDWFVVRVRVMLDGREIGADYLGGCAYSRATDFVEGENRDFYFRDMVRAAVAEARQTLNNSPVLRAA